ncbi:MAG: VWA-like domain-containing protein [Desulfobacteraceae bacterium]|jgi:predicted metal-dependent peptidase
MKVSLSEAFTYLLSSHQRNFYARVISALTRIERRGLGTCAVGISPEGKYLFYYDPDFLAKIPFKKMVLILEHEVYHLILGHIPRYLGIISGLVLEEETRKFNAAMNVAMDCASNELMRSGLDFDKNWGQWFYPRKNEEKQEMEPGFIIAESFGLPPWDAFEVYLFQLVSRMRKTTQKLEDGSTLETYAVPVPGKEQQGGQQGGQEGQQGGQEGQQGGQNEIILEQYFNMITGGNHRFWSRSLNKKFDSEEMQSIADKLLQEGARVIRSAVKEQLKSQGTVPDTLKTYIEELLATPKIPWPRVLRNMCTQAQQSKKDRGLCRPNRRLYGVPGIIPFPGRTKDFSFNIAFIVDTSGSMSTDELTLALNELLNLVHMEKDISLLVMYCDATLHTVYNVEKTEDIDFSIVGRGGTSFDPPFIRLRELMKTGKEIDLVVYATDGYADPPNPANRVPRPVIWLLTPRSVHPAPGYGVAIQMEAF